MKLSEHTALVNYMRGTVKPTLKYFKRGYINIDAATLAAVTSGNRVPSALSINAKRLSSLADNIYQFCDAAGNVLATNA